jgi:tripartite-type tricarboxylate transporter receptor subunit TctC
MSSFTLFAGTDGCTTMTLGIVELFKLTFALDLVTVPFNSAGLAVQSVVGGHTPIAFLALPPVASNIKSGNLRALAVLAKKRSVVIPDVPTMEESGILNQESDALTGVVVPAGTPRGIIDLLNRCGKLSSSGTYCCARRKVSIARHLSVCRIRKTARADSLRD